MIYFSADCGATNTSWAIYSDSQDKISSGILDGVNFFEEHEEGIIRLIAQISELDLPNIDYAGFSIAGTGTPLYHDRAVSQIQKLRSFLNVSKGIYLYNDGEAALWSSFENSPGISIISGTGAIAYGKNSNGEFFRCGGWGIWAGDEGSAYWIAHEAVRAVFFSYDGRREKTLLTDVILNKYNLSSVPELISLIPKADKKDVASISYEVSKAADLGDKISLEILKEAGVLLSEQVLSIITKIGYSTDLKVSCHGSVLQKNDIVMNSFKHSLYSKYEDIVIINSHGRSERGVFLLILDSISRGVPPEIL